MNSRAALLAGAPLLTLATLGAPGVARAVCAPSLQTISGPHTGPVVSNGGAITVTGSGKISGDPDGIDAAKCAITKLAIKPGGTILGTARGAGVANSNTITTLTLPVN
jgi:hypothetical protein